MDTDGLLHIYDYKTGTPPTKDQQVHFDKQLLLEAAMAERGGFPDLGRGKVAEATFIGMGATPKEVPAPIDEDEEGTAVTWERALQRLTRNTNPNHG